MKNLFFIALIFAIVATSCSSGENKEKSNENLKQKEGGIEIGTLGKGNLAEAKLSISFDKAVALMKESNRLTQEFFDYNYTNAWVEVVETGNNSYSYFLALDADLTAKGNYKTYSCYTVFTELWAKDYILYFHPESTQYSLRGKCCGKCNLVFKDGKLDTECAEDSGEENCKGKGRCSLSVSEEISKEQIKNEMI